MQDQYPIAIPKPCHANWAEMTREEKGRYCRQCDKVVRDFTTKSAQEIVQELEGVEGEVCGWLPLDQLTPVAPEHAEIWMRYPIQRLRIFLLAFLAVFGLEVWAAPELEAADWDQFRSDIQAPETMAKYVSDIQGEKVRLAGKVMDAADGTPVSFASVTVYYQDELVTGVYTREDGLFELNFKAKEVDYNAFTVKIRYLGNEVVQENVAPDVEEMMVFITTGVTMNDVHITVEAYRNDYGPWGGGVVVMQPDRIAMMRAESIMGKWYGGGISPLNDKIQMNRSDVYYLEEDPLK